MTYHSPILTQGQLLASRVSLVVIIFALITTLMYSPLILWGGENEGAQSKKVDDSVISDQEKIDTRERNAKKKPTYLITPNLIYLNRPVGDHLAVYQLQIDRPDLIPPLKFEVPKNCKVPTPDKAENVAKTYRQEHKESPKKGEVVALILVGRKVPAFAEKGDYIWVVRYVTEDGDILDELWISSTTGSCISVFDITPQVPSYY
ncbi:MAG: hypothetical protein COA78_35520, partial [Blastopirellula sp.]